ncbi:MAG: DUF6677 family protein [Terriglobia bacterium]
MASKVVQEKDSRRAQPKLTTLVRLCVAAWLVPGLGHFLLGRKWRALILFAVIVTMFLMGIAMQGEFFTTSSGSYLQTLGYFGELCVGLAMPVARFFGYGGGNPLFVSADFGTAYLVAAGMLNTLPVLDTYDIAMGRKP